MFKRLLKILENISPGAGGAQESRKNDSIELAVAILLVEVMHADYQLDEREGAMVVRLLQGQFEMTEPEAIELFAMASEKMKHAVSLYQYTSRLNRALSYQQKQNFMINLWRVVFADGQVDKYEEHLVRRVADLIHLSHKDFIKAKHFAEANPV